MSQPITPWSALRHFTSARIALGRVGASLPTQEVLAFGVAHAQARDAVYTVLDIPHLQQQLQASGYPSLVVHSLAENRQQYLCRPDLGRRLNPTSRTLLSLQPTTTHPVVFVVADGLSAIAAQQHALPLLHAVFALAPTWQQAPVVIAQQARVALADEIGELMGAEIVVILIGERPGLSSPDSLGVYLTYAPHVGRHDAERNCISNIRPQGLSYQSAAETLVYLLQQAQLRQLSGVLLKDDRPLLAASPNVLPEG